MTNFLVGAEINSISVGVNDSLVRACGLEASSCEGGMCYHLKVKMQLEEKCVEGDSYDYFSRSEISFICSFLLAGVWIAGENKKCLLKCYPYRNHFTATAAFAFTLVRLKSKFQINNDSTAARLSRDATNLNHHTGMRRATIKLLLLNCTFYSK